MKRKIAVVIGSRANYASIKSVIRALKNNTNIELQIFVGASAILEKYGNVINLIKEDGFKIRDRFYMIIEGENPETMSMSTGLGIIKLTEIFTRYTPDIVITIGDRFETIATAISAVYLNIHLAHTMGGEVSGTIDESIRHAVTKFSHIHFPASKRAYNRIIKMGENSENVFLVGCPRIDIVKEIIDNNHRNKGINDSEFWKKYKGVGGKFSLTKDKFLLVLQHPVTMEFGKNRENIRETLMVLRELKMPTIMLWPNADAGSDEISKEIRSFRERYKSEKWLHLFKNLPMDIFISLMDNCSCMVGNSSSAIREGAIVGVPAVNIGTRQIGREKGKNIINVDYDRDQILEAIKSQLHNGKYKPNNIYGDGKSGERIAKILTEIDLDKIPIQKRICY